MSQEFVKSICDYFLYTKSRLIKVLFIHQWRLTGDLCWEALSLHLRRLTNLWNIYPKRATCILGKLMFHFVEALTAFSAASSKSSAVINVIPLSCERQKKIIIIISSRKGGKKKRNKGFPSRVDVNFTSPWEFSFPGRHWCLQGGLPQVL